MLVAKRNATPQDGCAQEVEKVVLGALWQGVRKLEAYRVEEQFENGFPRTVRFRKRYDEYEAGVLHIEPNKDINTWRGLRGLGGAALYYSYDMEALLQAAADVSYWINLPNLIFSVGPDTNT